MITILAHLPNKTLLTLPSVDTTSTVRQLEENILNQINDPSIQGCVIKSMSSKWFSNDDKILVSTLLSLDPSILRLKSLKPSEEQPKKLGYQSEASIARRTIRVVNFIGKTTKELPPTPTKVEETTAIKMQETTAIKMQESNTMKRRGSVDPNDPDSVPQPSRRRSRDSIIYVGADPTASNNNDDDEDNKNTINTFEKPAVEHTAMKYLVGVDGSEISHVAYSAARSLMTRQNGDKIEILHICDRSKTYLPFDLQPDYILRMYDRLLLDVPKDQKSITVLNKPSNDDPEGYALNLKGTKAVVCKYASDMTYPDGIDGVPTHDCPDILVVGMVGRKGPKLNPHVLGSAVDYSMRNVACACLVVKTSIPSRGNSNMKPRTFVVAIDGSKSSHQSFLNTMRMCDKKRDIVTCVIFYDSRVAILDSRIIDPNDIAEKYRVLLNEAGVTRSSSLAMEKGLGFSFGECLINFAFDNDAHVLSLGTDGMKKFLNNGSHGSSAGLGSTSDYCIKKCKCNVLISKENGALY